MRVAVPTQIQINERDIYLDGWECRSTYDSLITDSLKLMNALNRNNNQTIPLIKTSD